MMRRWHDTPGRRLRLAAAMLVLVAIGAVSAQTAQPAAGGAMTRDAFRDAVDLDTLGQIAVHRDGRVKTFESYAREMMSFVTGSRSYDEQGDLYTYMDLMLRPEAYADAPIIYVKSKLIRAQIAEVLRRSMQQELEAMRVGSGLGGTPGPREQELLAELEGRLADFMKTGLISEPMLNDPQVTALLQRLETDVLRSAKFVRMIDSARAVKDPRFLLASLRVVPPATGGFEDRWMTLDELGRGPGGPAAEVSTALTGQWSALKRGWRTGDAGAVNAAAAELASLLPAVNADLYPAQSRLAWESWYFRMKNMVWAWIVYALALIPLVLFAVFRWRGALWVGLGLFLAAFALQTFAVMLRWYVADRWPNSNMFEAVTTAAWFGGCLAVLLEIGLRRSPMRGLFALGSGTASMFALMAAHYLPLQLNPGIGNMMPVLNDVWLYIHTNVIIFSYCLIFMASVSAFLYLAYRGVRAVAGKAGGAAECARVGGAGSLIMRTPEGGSYLTRAKTTLGQVLDGTTMILLELSFILLWTGLVMGAIWADHSWGRPWGWDPKEVFALNTFLIFALLIHTRFKVRDKGLWTALLAIVGCGVMLFNWVVINFTISGLHSYA